MNRRKDVYHWRVGSGFANMAVDKGLYEVDEIMAAWMKTSPIHTKKIIYPSPQRFAPLALPVLCY